jgi:putative transposase
MVTHRESATVAERLIHCHVSIPWYNTEHHHSGLGLLTPADVHQGLAAQRVAARATVLATAYATHPERFSGGLPQPPACPQEVWINRPGMPVTEEASSVIACDAAVSFRAESAILDPRGTTG